MADECEVEISAIFTNPVAVRGKRKVNIPELGEGGSVAKKGKKPPVWSILWTDEVTISLIQWYQQHSYLWNAKNSDYHDKIKKKLCIESWLKESQNWPENSKVQVGKF